MPLSTFRTACAALGATALLAAPAGAALVKGTASDDTLTGTEQRDRLRGGTGDDVLDGLGGPDRIWAGPGVDTSRGGEGDDRLWAVAVQDVERLGDETGDTLDGGPGRDRIVARDGERDAVSCGEGRDRVLADQFDVVADDCERRVVVPVTQERLERRKARAARRAAR